MTASLFQRGDQPVFAHQVRNMLARQEKEDREAIGALLDRRGFRRQDIEAAATKHHARIGTMGIGVNFHRASPLTGRPRQSSGARIPHFDLSRVTAKHPLVGKDGKARTSLRNGPSSAVGHFDYVTRGAVVTLTSHLDYIRRDAAVEDLEAGLVIDMLDEAELRNEQNRLALFSNIEGGLTRQRSLFEAAERCARKPRRHELVASTQMLPAFEAIHEHVDDAPGSMADMIRRLRESHQRAEEKATKTGQPLCHVTVPIALVTPEQASDWLAFFDRWPTMVSWKQGRTGRSQIRFVGDLPANLTPVERHAIVQRFCYRLAEFGYMYVAAIHQPDPQSNRANHHVHVDAYDRPAKWLDEHGCWDFDYREKRGGKTVYPYRQNKVRHEALDANGRKIRCNDAALMRRLFIDEVNAFVGGRPGVAEFLHGTYAENGVRLTPLAHMGNRAIAAEKRGVATTAGTINAHRIVRDELRICESRAAAAERELDREMVLMRRMSADEAALAEYEALRRRSIERRVQAEFCEVIVAMARSRADAVASALTAPGVSSRTQVRDGALLKAAQAHLGWVEREAPTEAERNAVSRRTAAMEREAEQLRVRILDDCGRSGVTNLRYRPRNREAAPVRAPDPRFEAQMRGRLVAWIDRHGADSERLVIETGEVALADSVPPSIDTLMRRFRAEQDVQRALRRAESRRKRAAAAAVHRSTAPSSNRRGVITLPIARSEKSASPQPVAQPKPTDFIRATLARRADGAAGRATTVSVQTSAERQSRQDNEVSTKGENHEYDPACIADLTPVHGVRAVLRLHLDDHSKATRNLLHRNGRPGDGERSDPADHVRRGAAGSAGVVENRKGKIRDTMKLRGPHDAPIPEEDELPFGWQNYRGGGAGR